MNTHPTMPELKPCDHPILSLQVAGMNWRCTKCGATGHYNSDTAASEPIGRSHNHDPAFSCGQPTASLDEVERKLTPVQRVCFSNNKVFWNCSTEEMIERTEQAITEATTTLQKRVEELEALNAREQCIVCKRLWSPSIIESSVCIFCIAAKWKIELDTALLQVAAVERKLRAAETLHIILLAWSAEIQKYQSWKANQRAEGKVDITTNQICDDYEKLSPLTDKALHEWNAAKNL